MTPDTTRPRYLRSIPAGLPRCSRVGCREVVSNSQASRCREQGLPRLCAMCLRRGTARLLADVRGAED